MARRVSEVLVKFLSVETCGTKNSFISCVRVCVCIYEIAHNRVIRPRHPIHYMPLA